MSLSKVGEVLQKQQSTILDEWLAAQMASTASRADLVSEAELRNESEHFLSALALAIKAGQLDIRAVEYQPVLDQLSNLSQSWSRKGFSPSETASFVFSCKQPLLGALRIAHEKDLASLAEDTWTASTLLDQLGLYTTEVYQQAREDVIRRQQEEMLELSTPVVQLWDGIVALPLIGTLDSARTNVVMESLLQTVVSTRSEIAIIDITGVPTVDTLVAQHLLKTVAAARLMGVECIISGIRPQIAQTMVHLGVELNVVSKATLADAFALALRRTGRAVVRKQAVPVATASEDRR